jgi:hypothetical protein
MACCNPSAIAESDAVGNADRTAAEEFAFLIRQTQALLLHIDRPYLALCLQQFERMALADWPADPALGGERRRLAG